MPLRNTMTSAGSAVAELVTKGNGTGHMSRRKAGFAVRAAAAMMMHSR
jgi:hypothetical protein